MNKEEAMKILQHYLEMEEFNNAGDFLIAIDIVLNLIEKQSKEIEELKRKEQLIKTYKGNLPENVEIICLCKNDFERNISNDYIPKSKVKEKIEQLKLVKNTPVKDNKYTYKECIEYGIEELQELLEGE